MKTLCLFFILALIASVAEVRAESGPVPIGIEPLPNAFRVDDKVISGGLPEGDAGFAALKELGVQAIISVDGAKPDVEAAQVYGLRYVHLPHGYDGISQTRVLEIAKALTELPGPIYIHCHHGKHRSPAAAAAACIVAGRISFDAGQRLLAVAGTGPEYQGLFRAVASAKPVDDGQLESLEVEFKESAAIPPMAAMMVDLEHTFDTLKRIQAAGWTTPPSHPDVTAAHEALLLREHFTEMLRTTDFANRPDDFRGALQHSLEESAELETLAKASPIDAVKLGATFALIQSDCKSCHRADRDGR